MIIIRTVLIIFNLNRTEQKLYDKHNYLIGKKIIILLDNKNDLGIFQSKKIMHKVRFVFVKLRYTPETCTYIVNFFFIYSLPN